jgi:hypothetical protein
VSSRRRLSGVSGSFRDDFLDASDSFGSEAEAVCVLSVAVLREIVGSYVQRMAWRVQLVHVGWTSSHCLSVLGVILIFAYMNIDLDI